MAGDTWIHSNQPLPRLVTVERAQMRRWFDTGSQAALARTNDLGSRKKRRASLSTFMQRIIELLSKFAAISM